MIHKQKRLFSSDPKNFSNEDFIHGLIWRFQEMGANKTTPLSVLKTFKDLDKECQEMSKHQERMIHEWKAYAEDYPVVHEWAFRSAMVDIFAHSPEALANYERLGWDVPALLKLPGNGTLKAAITLKSRQLELTLQRGDMLRKLDNKWSMWVYDGRDWKTYALSKATMQPILPLNLKLFTKVIGMMGESYTYVGY